MSKASWVIAGVLASLVAATVMGLTWRADAGASGADTPASTAVALVSPTTAARTPPLTAVAGPRPQQTPPSGRSAARATATATASGDTALRGGMASSLTGLGDTVSERMVTPVVFYLGGPDSTLEAVATLADGSVLAAGASTTLDWVPPGVTRTALSVDLPPSGDSGRVAFLVHLSADLSRVLQVAHLPKGRAVDFRRLRFTGVPGGPLGELYVSGTLAPVEGQKRSGGYFIARFESAVTNRLPTRVAWAVPVWADGETLDKQPWDVGSDGKVVYAIGGAHGYDWFSVQRLTADGKPDVVEHWRVHLTSDSSGKTVEWLGTPASKCPVGKVTSSMMVLKVWGRGDMRSWTQADYDLWTPDGNGGRKKGKWPWDMFFAGPFNPRDPGSSPRGRGYIGYGWPGTPCGNAQAIVIDRRTGDLYIGGNNKSALPKGPDFEPYVLAMGREGELRWWMRLYEEVPPPEGKPVTDNQDGRLSTPDQYVDAMAIDYTQPPQRGALVVVARCHGNNRINFWAGNAIKHPDNPGWSFQPHFTGTNGNIHYSWIGRMTLADGTMLHSTYLGEYTDGAKVGKDTWDDPNLDGWPMFTSGWPDINSTRVRPSMAVDGAGRVYVLATGRRPITTANAWRKSAKPGAGMSVWQDFARVYSPDLTTLAYSTILSGPWDLATGAGASDPTLLGVAPITGGVLLVGRHDVNKEGQLKGPPIPTSAVPKWAAAGQRPTRQTGFIARLGFLTTQGTSLAPKRTPGK